MKTSLPSLALAFTIASLSAQEIIPADQLEKVVPRLIERASDQENLPLKVDGDAAGAFGMSAKNHGALLIPNKGLSADMFKNPGKETIVLGQLWMKDLSPAVEGKPAAADKLRLIKIVLKEEEHQLPLLLLGVRRQDDKAELLVYGRGSEPLLRLPMTKTDLKQEKPLELDMRKVSDDLGAVDVSILGQFKAEITVGLLAR
jgi:hypothetical protein